MTPRRLGPPPLIGREAELGVLRRELDAALAGATAFVLVAGEPGIGKTRVLQEVAALAEERGAHVLWGRCQEEQGAPPFWPWVQVLRAYIRERPPETLRAELGAGTGEIVRIVPELRERLPEVDAAPEAGEPEQARFRLFEGITAALRAAAATRPLVLLLDDLHWADAASLQLLRFVARELDDAALLLAGTYRDTEVGHGHPLAATLAELARARPVAQVHLRGMSEPEIVRYIEQAAGRPPAPALVAAVARQTEGNPFFAGEVVRLLATDGRLDGAGRETPATIPLPITVREAIRRRLDRLSSACNDLLLLAAVAGRAFDVRLLAASGGGTEGTDGSDGTLQLLEEALAGRLIEETNAPGVYRFSHALIQETLLTEVSTARQAHLHGRLAEALARLYGGDAERHGAELALHFAAAAAFMPEHAAPALRYSRLAAERAEAATAWDEAARQYERCLALLERAPSPPDLDEAALLTAAGRCQRNAGEGRAGWRRLMQAREAYRRRDDAAGLARASLEALEILAPYTRIFELADDALDALGEREPALGARLLLDRLRLMLTYHSPYTAADCAPLLQRATWLAELQSSATLEAGLLEVRAAIAFREGRDRDAHALWLSAIDRFTREGRPERAGFIYLHAQWGPHNRGRLDEALALTTVGIEFARRMHVITPQRGMRVIQAGACLARCDHRRVAEVAEEARRIPGNPVYSNLIDATVLEMRGDLAGAIATLPTRELAGGSPGELLFIHGLRARVFFNAGDEAAARDELALWAENDNGEPFEIDECLPALGDEPFIRRAYARLTAGQHAVDHMAWLRPLDHQRGALALRLGRVEDAERHFRDGLNWAERERCPIETGRCLQGLAEIARLRGQPAEADHLLDRAIAFFDAHGGVLLAAKARAARMAPRATIPATAARPTRPEPNGFTERQADYLRLLAAGRTNKEIAAALVISVNAVEQMLVKLYDKIGARNRAEAIRFALDHGLADDRPR